MLMEKKPMQKKKTPKKTAPKQPEKKQLAKVNPFAFFSFIISFRENSYLR